MREKILKIIFVFGFTISWAKFNINVCKLKERQASRTKALIGQEIQKYIFKYQSFGEPFFARKLTIF